MHLKREFLVVGILIVLLSTLFATQYATTKVSFQYAIVHPSNADIRFVGSDNSSADGLRVLRVSGDNGSNAKIGLEFGNWSANMNTTYTAAFAIVNEEPFAVNITHVTVTNTSGTSDYMQVWLHGNGSLKAEDDPTSVFLYNNGTTYYTASSTAWVLTKGDGDTGTMYPDISDSATQITTGWDESVHVRYTQNLSGGNDDAFQIGSNGRVLSNASDFVWVQISINVPAGAVGGDHAGTIEVHFQASTHWASNTPVVATFSNPTEDGHIDTPGWSRQNTLTSLLFGSSYPLSRAYIEWDISSIPDTAIITKVVFKYHGESHTHDGHIHEMVGTRPSTSGNEDVYNEIGEGTVYADPDGFPIVGTNQEVDLGTSAVSDLQSQLTSNWFAIGLQSDGDGTYSSIYAEEYGSANPPPTLEVTYTP